MTLRLLLVALLLVPAAGCVGTRHGRPDVLNTVEQQTPLAPDAYRWQQALIGDARPKVLGYVKTLRHHVGYRQYAESHMVYDLDFQLVGRISSRGETVRISPKGKETVLGSFMDDKAVLLLLTGDLAVYVKLVPMVEPAERGLEARRRGLAAAPGQRKAITTW